MVAIIQSNRNADSELSLTSMRTTSFSRLSFDLATTSGAGNHHLAIKPHRSSSDSSYAAIHRRHQQSSFIFRDFRLLAKIGAGDIGTVYLCRLAEAGNDDGLYPMKVVDKEVLKAKKKTHRAEMENKVLRMLDHPFLPTMYAQFEASNFSCIVMEFCSGGDLHSLRHKQPHKRFSLSSARFYAAEVLVALEYLHMLGIIYRDLTVTML